MTTRKWRVIESPAGLALGLLLATSCTWANEKAAFDLITPAELAAEERALADPELAAKAAPPRRTRSLLPSIKVITPKSDGGTLKSPIRIELAFEPLGETRIDPSTLKVLYGMLRIDLTRKIRENARVTDKGVLAEEAKIPPGNHRLIVQVSDVAGRTAETELRVKVD